MLACLLRGVPIARAPSPRCFARHGLLVPAGQQLGAAQRLPGEAARRVVGEGDAAARQCPGLGDIAVPDGAQGGVPVGGGERRRGRRRPGVPRPEGLGPAARCPRGRRRRRPGRRWRSPTRTPRSRRTSSRASTGRRRCGRRWRGRSSGTSHGPRQVRHLGADRAGPGGLVRASQPRVGRLDPPGRPRRVPGPRPFGRPVFGGGASANWRTGSSMENRLRPLPPSLATTTIGSTRDRAARDIGSNRRSRRPLLVPYSRRRTPRSP